MLFMKMFIVCCCGLVVGIGEKVGALTPMMKVIESKKKSADHATVKELVRSDDRSVDHGLYPVGLQVAPLDSCRRMVKGLIYNNVILVDRIRQFCQKLVWAKRPDVVKEISEAREIAYETALRKIIDTVSEVYGDDNPTVLHFGCDIYLEREGVLSYLELLSTPDICAHISLADRDRLRLELQGYFDVLDQLDREVNLVIMGTDVRASSADNRAAVQAGSSIH